MEKVKYNYNKLKGRIKEYFGTYENFALSLGISATSINNKLSDNMPNTFSQDEIFYSIQRLNIQPNELIDIFFNQEVEQNSTNEFENKE